MPQQDFKAWNSIIRGLCIDTRHKEALTLLFQCLRSSIVYKPDHLVFAAILKSCTALLAGNLGRALHSFVVKLGHGTCQVTSKALLNMYAKYGAFDDCQKLFDQLSPNDPVIWNIVLSGFSGSKNHDNDVIRTFRSMHVRGEAKPNSVTIATILPTCARSRDLDVGRSAHAYVIKSGFENDTFVGNALVSFYAKCGLVSHDSFAVFSNIINKDVVSWNAMIAGLAENEFLEDAFTLFSLMVKGPLEPNYSTIASILPVCALFDRKFARHFGRQIHSYMLQRIELSSDISVSNSLLSFYVKVGQMAEAEYLFWKMDARDLVSWNTIIAGYASNGEWLKALHIFGNLTCAELLPDSVTIVSILPVCAQLRNLEVGKQIHAYVFRNPFLFEDTAVGNACVNFYAKCGDMEAALNTFFMISRKDIISWNSILDAFGEWGCGSNFLSLLRWMHREEIRPDSVTILTVINFCASLLQIEKVKEIHSYSIMTGFLGCGTAPTIGNAIIDAYSKCGNMEYAHRMFLNLSEGKNLVTFNSLISGYVDLGSHHDANMIFKGMSEKDITTWNLMVRVYAENDFPEQAFCLFSELQDQGMRPDAVTIMSFLPVCTQMASVHLLNQCHGYIIRSCFDDIRLNGALLDAYAKCGNIGCANKLFHSSNDKDLVMFTAMIGGYAMHGMSDEALGLFSHMLNLGIKPDHVIFTSVLSACSHAGLVDEGLKIFYSIEKILGIKPTLEQHACVVDLLARGGRVHDAYALVARMPSKANANVWGTLLGACKIHHEVELGCTVADQLFKIDSDDVGNYVVMSNIYAADARWDGVMEVRRMMRNKDMKKPVGCSWIEVDRTTNVFAAGDCSHPQRSIIYTTLYTLDQQIKEPIEF
ncbi:putative pentatricopeptide repeat-containing protein At5g08490 [Prosopis cineraria]|uniref:putative pentatricopeptide repeat-containing protein At5g08490 n=1 Tax=Prosopis cineraria TaxID=364024 RepID=UPI002410200D|nr:putative pentatricopeptide repeat-containing protein At5g08490 [Prosopis cineraria]XP_054821202.1 putative pentatricopeptide repeat-containing protein At5g08490 [Prosopis cineraria]XP_054821203.1 putative pentatricopeptide repeat-containing protein At5g08490 [Prosopis cineraria]XP_054821205.1 putative pentatricopeptide repeat-containing protein At5g08490 [Prosopis cineraria]XP_054821206.1 putative pentatricopeptide repeat-containing protein At5g08490 [Prosopis cineraria]XP_054821207.1 putat